MHVTVISFSRHITSLLSCFHILSLIIRYNFSCPLFMTRYIMFCQWFYLHFTKQNHREAPAAITEVMWVHACYLPQDCFIKLFSYNKVISLHNMYLFYSKFVLPFTTFFQVSTSIYWFNTLYNMQTFMLAELFRHIGISGRSISPNTANMQC